MPSTECRGTLPCPHTGGSNSLSLGFFAPAALASRQRVTRARAPSRASRARTVRSYLESGALSPSSCCKTAPHVRAAPRRCADHNVRDWRFRTRRSRKTKLSARSRLPPSRRALMLVRKNQLRRLNIFCGAPAACCPRLTRRHGIFLLCGPSAFRSAAALPARGNAHGQKRMRLPAVLEAQGED